MNKNPTTGRYERDRPTIVRDILRGHAANMVMELQREIIDHKASQRINVNHVINAMESACVEAMTKCCDMVFGEEKKCKQ